MAKLMPLNVNGVQLSYWKITGLSIAFVPGIAVINLGGYVSQEASKVRDSYCVPKNFRVMGSKFDIYFSDANLKTKDIRDCAYEYITMEESEFKDATDIFE